jgi:MinD superfamily P-loop ATPase
MLKGLEFMPSKISRKEQHQQQDATITQGGPMVHARLGIAEENSGRLVTKVRNFAADLTKNWMKSQILCDGPPGSGCPVIASVSGADRVLIVTEPTVSGVNDMQRVLELSHHFGVPVRIVINKADLNIEQAERIEALADNRRPFRKGGITAVASIANAEMGVFLKQPRVAHGVSWPVSPPMTATHD